MAVTRLRSGARASARSNSPRALRLAQRPRQLLLRHRLQRPRPRRTDTDTSLSAPTALSTTSVTSSSFTANWTGVSGATGYQLDVSTNSSFSSDVPGYQNLDVGNVTTYNVTGLRANTSYYW